LSESARQKIVEDDMINEDRVKELYQMAVFDEYKEKKISSNG